MFSTIMFECMRIAENIHLYIFFFGKLKIYFYTELFIMKIYSFLNPNVVSYHSGRLPNLSVLKTVNRFHTTVFSPVDNPTPSWGNTS